MKRTGLLHTSTLYSIALLAGAAFGSPSQAQVEAQPAPASSARATDVGEVVVTSSRIPRPNLESVEPITTVKGEEFFQTGETSIGNVLNTLPAFRATVSQANSTRTPDWPGINLLDLRGLGTNRTLVLQDGLRHVSGTPYGTAVDVNTIPTELIDRVDVVTGGSSAVFGSDAIAGVVNFILKRDYQGVQLHTQDGISSHGDAGQYFASVVAGQNFADGRGNIAGSVEYAKQDALYASERAHYASLDHFLPVGSDPPGTPNGSNGVPDQAFFHDIRYIGVSNGGQVLDQSTTDANGFFPAYNFNPDGTLTPQTGQRISLPPGGFTVGGNGSNNQDGQLYGLIPKLDRYGLNLMGHYTLSDAFEPFFEAKYIHVESIGSSTGSFFTGGSTGSPREFPSTDNPYLTSQARDLIRQTLGLGPGEDGQFYLGRIFLDLGAQQADAKRDTYRLVTGVKGTFNKNWSYQASANYGELDSTTTLAGNVNVQRYLLAIDAVKDPSGNIVCRSKLDPTAAVAYESARDPAFAQSQLAGDVAACQPLNPFGVGNVSNAAKAYVLDNTFSRAKVTQFVLNAYLNGDSAAWFSLPGGPVGFAAGAEYRRETYFNAESANAEAGLTFFTAQPAFKPPAFEVAELFGELRAPLLADRPFFKELTLSGAARLADYKGGTGTVLAWNGGVEWAPVQDVRFRANYSRAVRAPNLVEQYSGLGQSFEFITDPCSVQNIGAGSEHRVANCRAAGVPTGYDFTYLSSYPFLASGNRALEAETSDSFTIGAVVRPRFVPDLALSIDYYDIKVNNVITAPDAQDIVNACYDSSTLNNQFCSLFQRNISASNGPRGEIPGQILDNSLRVLPLNYAALKVRGIDVQVDYRRDLGQFGTLSTRLIYTHVLQNDSFLNPEDPGRADQLLLELGNPQDQLKWSVDLAKGPFKINYQLRYVGKMTPGAIENIKSVQGRPPEDADAFPIDYYSSLIYHSVRVSYDVNSKVNFYVGVDNITDQLPPYGLSGAGDEGAIYDNVGRFFYTGASLKF